MVHSQWTVIWQSLDKLSNSQKNIIRWYFVDDSHSSGYIGKTGRGTHEYFSVVGKIDIITTTFGKALGGASGGCVSGRAEIVEMCRQKGRPYLFSNTVAPVIVEGAMKVLDIISKSTERRDKLEKNTEFWRKGLTEGGIIIKEGETAIVPVMLFNAKLITGFCKRFICRRNLCSGILLSCCSERTGKNPHPAFCRSRNASS